ncbi:MAG: DNA polymerase I [Gammaproteobacteria bacterium]|nr:DNA polymerase I [Gammaproteobacteria bacterium]
MTQPDNLDNTLILVDGSSYLFRAFHAMPPLNTSAGQPTGAVYGVVNMVRRLIAEYQPGHLAVVFDAKGKNFRHELYPAYKANRPPMEEELRLQIEPTHELIRALGIPLLIVPGVEADDVIGTLAARADAAGMRTIISTADKDFAQLVNDRITLINTMTNSRLNPATVEEKFGVRPNQIIDYLALVGDSADNIPGVPKVGPKTAAKWLKQYRDLDTLTAQANEISGKIGENLRASLEQLPLSRDLATIRQDVALELTPLELCRQPADRERLLELLSEMEFKTWLREPQRLIAPGSDQTAGSSNEPDTGPTSTRADSSRYETLLEIPDLTRWLEKLTQAELFAIDLETTSLNYMEAEIVGFSFATRPGEAAYLPVAHSYLGAPPQIKLAEALEQLTPLLTDGARAKVGQNIKYDMSVLARYDIELQGVQFDTMLEAYVLDSNGRHDMDTLAQRHLNHTTIQFSDVAGKGKKQLTFNQVALEEAAPYAAEDADITLQLHQTFWPQLQQSPPLSELFSSMEMPLVPVLSQIERTGVLIDPGVLRQQSDELALGIARLAEEAHTLAGEEFNLASPLQIQGILFDKLGLPVTRKTPKGQPSTSEAVLQELAADYPLPRLILEHRSMSKLKSTYTDKLPQMVNPVTGRVHTSYHQAVTATGRLSSSDPNLQNIPIRSEEGRRIRQAFIAPPGCQLLAADYSQIELRIMAHLSADENLLQAFAQGEDVHRATAAEVFGVAPEQVSTDQRRHAKAINFGLIYGMSAFGLGQQLDIPRNEAQAYIERYFERYPGVKNYMDSTREQAREQGYVETVFGRRLYLPDIKARNAAQRQYAERTAINAPMQGTAADLIKRAMIRMFEWSLREAPEVRMIMQVHDELVFEVPDAAIDSATENIRQIMEADHQLSVPLLVEIGTGLNWDQAH